MEHVAWHGTAREFARLHEAVAEHCDCTGRMFGVAPIICGAHMMLSDQTSLDHLLYVYRMRKLFIRRELYALPLKSRVERVRPLWTAPPT